MYNCYFQLFKTLTQKNRIVYQIHKHKKKQQIKTCCFFLLGESLFKIRCTPD